MEKMTIVTLFLNKINKCEVIIKSKYISGTPSEYDFQHKRLVEKIMLLAALEFCSITEIKVDNIYYKEK